MKKENKKSKTCPSCLNGDQVWMAMAIIFMVLTLTMSTLMVVRSLSYNNFGANGFGMMNNERFDEVLRARGEKSNGENRVISTVRINAENGLMEDIGANNDILTVDNSEFSFSYKKGTHIRGTMIFDNPSRTLPEISYQLSNTPFFRTSPDDGSESYISIYALDAGDDLFADYMGYEWLEAKSDEIQINGKNIKRMRYTADDTIGPFAHYQEVLSVDGYELYHPCNNSTCEGDATWDLLVNTFKVK